MNNDDRHYLGLAIELAAENVAQGGGPFGAVVVKDGQVVATGCNRVTDDHDPTAHAEVVAIRNACRELGSFQLDGCVLYASCEPCPMCLGAIYWARPDALVFAAERQDAADVGFDDSLIYDEVVLPVSERRLPSRQVAHPDVMRPFEAWVAKSDRTDY